MRISPMIRGARAYGLATLVCSLVFSPSYARMGGSAGGSFAHPAFGMGHFSHFAPRGLNRRFETGRLSLNRFGPKRFDRFGFNRFNRFRFDRFGRFGGNQLFVDGWGWGGWAGAIPGSAAASEPIVVGEGAPVIINIGFDPGPGDAGGAYRAGCVVHKLNYDSSGKYVGERQIPQC